MSQAITQTQENSLKEKPISTAEFKRLCETASTEEEARKILLAAYGCCKHKHLSDKEIRKMEEKVFQELLKEHNL